MKPLCRWGRLTLTLILVIFAVNTFYRPSTAFAAPANTGMQAPEFPADLSWINTAHPLSLKKLHGKIVLLDFWTYGCINCIHIIPDLDKLQKNDADQLAIIGVHSAKFQNEKDADNIRNAVLRYGIEHPVAVDNNLEVWNAYGVNAWPTLILIDPDGRIAGRWEGEGNFTAIDVAIKGLIDTFRSRKELNETPLKIALDSAGMARTPLLFPGKVLAGSGKLYIADSGHNRIVETDSAGNVLAIAGNGQAGLKDGGLKTAQFNFPQGMTLSDDGETLYVADTDNHAIRAVDFEGNSVRTIAGNGKQADFGSTGDVGTAAELSSPWDVCRVGNILYIAMAGTHQIWKENLLDFEVHPFAGSGTEARTDGELAYSAFAQPSGLATDGKTLFVADSESSSIRAVDLTGAANPVKTLAGGNLFDFGDRDATGLQARFQHPLGLATDGKVLFIADTYNHKIKQLNLADDNVKTLLGTGRGMAVGKAPMFYEPGGLSLDGENLYIADTNNNRIVVDNLSTGKVSALDINPPLPEMPQQQGTQPLNQENISVPPVVLAPGAKGTFILDVTLPAGHHLNTMSPLSLKINTTGAGLSFAQTTVDQSHFRLPLTLPFTTAKTGEGTLKIDANIYYCTNDFGLCKWKELQFTVPYSVSMNGQSFIKLATKIAR